LALPRRLVTLSVTAVAAGATEMTHALCVIRKNLTFPPPFATS
jgi:hypothetical protein